MSDERDIRKRRPYRTRRQTRHHLHPRYSRRDELEDAFDQEWRGYDRMALAPEDWSFGALAPEVDVVETDDAILVEAEIPGLDEADMAVTFGEGLLTIRGEKPVSRGDQADRYLLSERAFGAFRRSIPIDVEIDEDNVSAQYKGGVLTVILPKAESNRRATKRIDISSG